MATGGAAGAGAAAAAAAAAAAWRRRKIVLEVLDIMEAVKCPSCGQGTLLPLFGSNSTNWVCSQPTCNYVIHQHGSRNSRVWKGEATRENTERSGAWLETE
ncbi:MAG: hypothetical protein ABIJ61_01505, partial [bacterium]